jgi:hypothetical protein
VPRILIALASLAAAVAFALTLREHDRCEDARRTVFATTFGRGPVGEQTEAIETIRRTCRGTTALLSAVGALRAQGRADQALPLAREAAEAEPDNPAAWRAVATVASGTEASEAERRLRSLNPSLNDSAGRSTR